MFLGVVILLESELYLFVADVVQAACYTAD